MKSLLDPLIHRKLTSRRPTLPLFRAGSRCSPSSTLFSGSILLPWTIIKQGYSDCNDAPRGDGELDSHIIHFYFKERGDFFDNHFVPNFLSLFPCRRPSGAPFGSSLEGHKRVHKDFFFFWGGWGGGLSISRGACPPQRNPPLQLAVCFSARPPEEEVITNHLSCRGFKKSLTSRQTFCRSPNYAKGRSTVAKWAGQRRRKVTENRNL